MKKADIFKETLKKLTAANLENYKVKYELFYSELGNIKTILDKLATENKGEMSNVFLEQVEEFNIFIKNNSGGEGKERGFYDVVKILEHDAQY